MYVDVCVYARARARVCVYTVCLYVCMCVLSGPTYVTGQMKLITNIYSINHVVIKFDDFNSLILDQVFRVVDPGVRDGAVVQPLEILGANISLQPLPLPMILII